MSETKATIAGELRAGRTVITETKGVSMRPLLLEGKSHVLIEPLDRELKRGELPIFIRSDGKYVIHRVIAVEKEHYITRGDNCIGSESVLKEQVLGVVTVIYRGNRTIPVSSKRYGVYVGLWMGTAFLRIPIYRLRAWIKRQ